jgi:hypothetical protein
MNLRQDQSPTSAEFALETVSEWPLWLTEVERRIGPRFTRREARGRAGRMAKKLMRRRACSILGALRAVHDIAAGLGALRRG